MYIYTYCIYDVRMLGVPALYTRIYNIYTDMCMFICAYVSMYMYDDVCSYALVDSWLDID